MDDLPHVAHIYMRLTAICMQSHLGCGSALRAAVGASADYMHVE